MRKLLLLPLFVLALAAASPAGADDHPANITASGFVPTLLKIPNGDRIVWKNNDTIKHQIVADDGSFSSAVLQPGQSYAHIFVNAGTYKYHDGTKPTEKGVVDVTQTRVVLMRQPVRVVTFPRAITLRGSISPANTGRVTVQAREPGADSFDDVTTTSATNGIWRVVVKPGQNTVYRAVWKNVPSNERAVFVKPLVSLKQVGRRLFGVSVHAAANLRYHRVLIQRRTHHGWRTLKSVRLKRLRATATQVVVSASFRLRLAHGTIIRALMTRAQAAPFQYGPAVSRPLRL
jgi:plastocyanin